MINHRSSAILSIGKVNLSTGNNTMFGKIWDCWEQDANTSDILVQDMTDPKRLMAVHTSGHPVNTIQSYPVGTFMTFHHDQSRRAINGDWKVIGVVEHTEKGLTAIRNLTGVNSVTFYTFK